MPTSLIVPHAEPFLRLGGSVGCLLLHGFSSMPEEMVWLGDALHAAGHTVLGARLAGHATHPRDLARTRWTDWLVTVEEGLALLRGVSEQQLLLGLSMGGMIALTAAARQPVAGVVALSTPVWSLTSRDRLLMWLGQWVPMLERKSSPPHPALGLRREADYPAYGAVPRRIYLDVAALQMALQAALPHIRVPAMLVQSRTDPFVPPDSLSRLTAAIGSTRVEPHLLDDFDHALVRDPKRATLFVLITDWIGRVVTRD